MQFISQTRANTAIIHKSLQNQEENDQQSDRKISRRYGQLTEKEMKMSLKHMKRYLASYNRRQIH